MQEKLDANNDRLDNRLALRPAEAAEMLGISPRLLWSLTAAGRVPHVRLGRSVRYPLDALRHWLRRQAEQQAAG